jgi:pimeloyl-ACP methyl ester carboxylesterase
MLASSAVLRRTVVNPYVMDRDIVAMLSGPLVATRAHRRAVTQYLASISGMGAPWPSPLCRTLLAWSAENLLYPIPRDASWCLSGADVTAISLPGAAWFAIEEHPWEVADAVLAWLGPPTAPVTATSMS